jgi:predicted porin
LVAAGEGSASVGRTYGFSGRYLQAPFDVIVGYGRQEGSGSGSGALTALAVGGSYTMSFAKVYIGFTDEKNSCSTCTGALARGVGVSGGNASEFRLINLGVRVPIDLFTAVFQAVRVDDRSEYAVDPGNRDTNWFAIGGEYAMSKRTTLYSALGTIGNRNGSLYALGSGGVQQPANFVATGNPRSTTATIGVRHLF